MNDFLLLALHSALSAAYLIIPMRFTGALASRRGRAWLALYLVCSSATSFFHAMRNHDAFDSAITSLFFPVLYATLLYVCAREERRKVAKATNPTVTAADRPAAPPGPAP